MSTKCQQNVNKIKKTAPKLKKSAVFFCEICDYTTSHKSHYTKHLNSKKHVNKMSTKSEKTAPKKCRKVPFFFNCEFCLKNYKSRQGLWAHKKKCKKNISVSSDENRIIIKNKQNNTLNIVSLNNENNEKILDSSEKILEDNENNEFVTLKKDDYIQKNKLQKLKEKPRI